MMKRLTIISVCVLVGLSLSMQAFSQDEPVNTDDKVVTGEKKDSAPAPAAEGAQDALSSAAAGSVYNDGNNTYINGSVKLKLTARDNISMGDVYYKINDGAAVKYAEPISFTDEGTKKVAYYGVDLNGNEEREKRYVVIVDLTGPEAMIATNRPLFKKGETVYFAKNYAFSIAATDKLSGVRDISYAVNGAKKAFTTTFSIESDSPSTLGVTAVDNVSNSSEAFTVTTVNEAGEKTAASVTSLTLTPDFNAPVVQVKADKEFVVFQDNKIAKTDFSYSITAEDTASGVKTILYRVDGKGEFMPYSKAITFTTSGEHIIEAQAVDNVGNISDVVILKVIVDMIAPETRIETVTK